MSSSELEETNVCKECLKECISSEFLRRHVKSHKISYQQYVLKWKYEGIEPECKCGCGNKTNWSGVSKDYCKYFSGHQSRGRIKSDDEKRRIGEKNAINMRRYMKENPDVAKKANERLRKGITPESEARRIETLRNYYKNLSQEEKEKISKHAKNLWTNSRDIMMAAAAKGGKTHTKRFLNGEYDNTERNKKISETVTKMYLEGSFKFGKGYYKSTKTNLDCYYRSSWESEFTSIPYEYLGATHKYIPDFHVEKIDGHYLIEVKPMALRSIDRNIAKRLVALEYCAQNNWTYQEWEPSDISCK